MRWITATRLEEWARTITSESGLPEVVSDLIRASAADINSIRFPSGEKGRVRGFDGHLQSSSQELNVPEGNSYWEFGRGADYQDKATREFTRVSAAVSVQDRAEATFVFVSPWTWDSSISKNKIEDWCSARQKESPWKGVVYIDGVALEDWFLNCPATAAWHARNTFKCAPAIGVRSTDEFWSQFANRFSPCLTEEVVLCERESAIEQLLTTLMATSGSISLSADSSDEVIAFAIAAIRKAKPEVRLFLEARTLVIDNMEAGRFLIGRNGLVYFLREDAALSPSLFAATGPTLVPLSRQQRSGSAQQLNRPSGQAMGMAIETMGFHQNKALTLARGSGSSLAALARQIPGGSSSLPAWMPDAPSILSAILAGGWDSDNANDKEVIKVLAGVPDYLQFEVALRKFLRDADPPFDREGNIWKVRAPMDAFIHVGHLIGQEHLEALRSAMSTVFSQVEALPQPDDLVGLPKGKSLPHSEWLRDGLATTLLLLANWETQAELTLGAGAGQRFADELVGSLQGLSSDVRLLASLQDELPLLAEAAPRPLLAALELMLEGDGSTLLPIFEGREGLMFPVYKYVGLLRALEVLAWDPSYFDRATLVLARMAAIDPGSKIVNSPMNSLKEIFILWNPNTNASRAQRMTMLDKIAAALPEVGWNLICLLLPTFHGALSPTSRPVLREAGASDRSAMTYAELWKQQAHVTQKAISLASDRIDRWNYLISVVPNFQAEEFEEALTSLDKLLSRLPEDERLPLWTELNKEVLKHARFADAQWALSPERLPLMREVAERYRPVDPFFALKELFDEWALEMPGLDSPLNSQRLLALRSLTEAGDTKTILRLSEETRNTYQLVQCLSDLGISEDYLKVLWLESFKASPNSRFTLGLAGIHRFIAGAATAEEWLAMGLQESRWHEADVARFLLFWPDEENTWFAARRLGSDVENGFWKEKSPYWLKGSRFSLLRAVLSLVRHGRWQAAMKSSLNRLAEIPDRLLLKFLDGIVAELNSSQLESDSMTGYEVEKVFEELDRRPDVADAELARREFAYLPLLEHSKRVLRLYRILAREPDLYHEFLRMLFRANDEPAEKIDKAGKDRARQAYTLLSKFRMLPGLNDGDVDATALTQWVDRVRKLGVETRRPEITDQYVGHIFAHSISDPDGGWPHRAVRDQIDRLSSENIERGLDVERFNMRGVHSRAVFEGGNQEREIAIGYRRWASIATEWPRTAALLTRMAENWEHHAAYEDTEASQRKMKS